MNCEPMATEIQGKNPDVAEDPMRYAASANKFIDQYEKCLTRYSDCVEK